MDACAAAGLGSLQKTDSSGCRGACPGYSQQSGCGYVGVVQVRMKLIFKGFKRELRLCKQNACVTFQSVNPGTTADSSRRGSIVF